MPTYTRWYRPGGTYFFTLNLQDRRRDLLVRHVACLRKAFASIQSKRPFQIPATVVLPNHLHCIWTLPIDDEDFSERWSLIKAEFSRGIPRIEYCSASRRARRERGVWQRRFWEHLIRDQDDLNRHIDYIHYNPVKHGLVTSPRDWPYSSFHRYVRNGILDMNWSADHAVPDLDLD